MPCVVYEFVRLRELEGEIPYHNEGGRPDGDVHCVVPVRVLRETVFSDFDERESRKHSKVDDPEIQVHAEGPLFGGPMDGAGLGEEFEDGLEQPRLAHKPRNDGHRGEYLEHQEHRAIVVLVANEHRHVDDEIPHGDQWRKIV